MKTLTRVVLVCLCAVLSFTAKVAAQNPNSYDALNKRLQEVEVASDILEINHAHFKLSVSELEQSVNAKKDLMVLSAALERMSVDLIAFQRSREAAWRLFTGLTGAMTDQIAGLTNEQSRALLDGVENLIQRLRSFNDITDPTETIKKATKILEDELQKRQTPAKKIAYHTGV